MIKLFKSRCDTSVVWLLVILASGLCFPLHARDPIFADAVSARSMFSDKRAFAVGDLLSVVIQENSTATKDVSTKTAKKSGVDASIDSFLFSPGQSKFLTKGGAFPALKFGASSDFDGSGKINNSEKIVARVGVVVRDVLPNGNLVVEGKRQTSFSGESQDIILRGTVRPADVTPNNTVFSYQVADATINILSKGTASSTAKKGWFTRFWDKVTPF
ncbi:MAG: flagellar basal body L-ring protein FlgH [Verrucomicrobia bacterium]|nr:flagellar basal body L-ring protein FlgH [Verrucomicrobiota bacterium]